MPTIQFSTLKEHLTIKTLVVFKGKPGGRIDEKELKEYNKEDSPILCTVQSNAWVDKKVFEFWAKKLWAKIPKPEKWCLILDSFYIH